MFIDKIYY